MYVRPNFKPKKALKEAVAAGTPVKVFQPGAVFGGRDVFGDCYESVEGPHFPEPHRWYGRVTVKDGLVVTVK